MGEINKVKWVKLIVGLLTAHLTLLGTVRERLEKEWGSVDGLSEIMDFNYTRYYEEEMGKNLKRQFMSFTNLVDPGCLPQAKLFTNALEDELAVKERRRVNIDPGYLTPAKLILATTKDYSHRLYLGQGIYGEVTLIYSGDGFKPLPWTYPDYRSEDYSKYFSHVREVCRHQIRKESSIICEG